MYGIVTVGTAQVIRASYHSRVQSPRDVLMAQPHAGKGPPHALYTALEPRAAAELALLPAAVPFLLRAARGDGHPVLLVPGFMSSEIPLSAMKAFLRNRGYAVETWGFGRNVGLQRKHVAALEQKVRYLHHKHRRKVSIVGWSLGGAFALYVAHHAPECVRCIITLGSPVTVGPEGSQSSAMAHALYRLVAHPLGSAAHSMQPKVQMLRANPPVPTSCLYSVTDGVVPWHQATIDGNPALHENIRVPGSHCGLGFNAFVLWVVADRLSQPEGEWQPYRRNERLWPRPTDSVTSPSG
jgi:pimeloyl-ACP methyl ester carboxylesterase